MNETRRMVFVQVWTNERNKAHCVRAGMKHVGAVYVQV
jgi:hypothetical protein